MPVPQKTSGIILVEQASCLFLKNIWHNSCGTGRMPVLESLFRRCLKSKFSCGVGILPAHKKLLENGARCQLSLFLGL
jgi:hypothetical protein